MLPMMVGVMSTAIFSGIAITRTGRYKMFPIAGMGIATLGLMWMTTLDGDISMVLFSAMILVLGAGLGLVMQTIVLAVQNSVDPHELGTATSANNFFREIGAAVGVALFSTIFTGRLTDRLTEVFAGAPDAAAAGDGVASLTPAAVAALPEALQDGVVDAFADALAPAFWYLVPLLAAGFVLTLFLKEVTLSDVAGMVARGEAVMEDSSTPTIAGPESVAVGAAAAGALSPTTDGPQSDDRTADGGSATRR
jgi:hypothetical protein